MSIVPTKRHFQNWWLRWLYGLFALAVLVTAAIVSVRVEAEEISIPEEPGEVIIASDEDEAEQVPAKDAPAEGNEYFSDQADEEPTQEPEDSGETTESTTDDSVAEEVAQPDEATPDELEEPAEQTETSADEELSTPPETQPARPAVEGARFKGVLPGTTTVKELEAAWGPAEQVKKVDGAVQQFYRLPPFKQVVASVVDGKVDTLIVHLVKPLEPAALAKQLKIDDVQSAMIYNSKGQVLGMAFPERGVLLSLVTQATEAVVAQIVVEPVNSQPFVTRAEENRQLHPTSALADVDFAIQIDPDYDRAHFVRAQVLCELGEFSAAHTAIDRALAMNADDLEYQLALAKISLLTADYKQAELEAESLVSGAKPKSLIRAEGHLIWGNAIAASQPRALDEALTHHTEAIKLAESVASKSYGPVRRAAKELLMDAHLAVAYDIAWGNWQQKNKVVPQWLDRADAFCDHLIDKEAGPKSARLRLYQQTLAAYAGMKDPPSIAETIDAMTTLGQHLIAEEKNTTRQQLLAWQMGEALANAMLIAQAQKHVDDATQFGERALVLFKQAHELGKAMHEHSHLLGRVIYRLGTIQAINAKDSKKAVTWYDQAVPLLETPAPPSTVFDRGRQGEMFVSMAVSYWEVGKRDEALRLTQQGVKLMEQAVGDDQLSKAALSIPYGNLASMHQELGNPSQAKELTEMSARAGAMRR